MGTLEKKDDSDLFMNKQVGLKEDSSLATAKELGKRIREARERLGLTQAELAQKLAELDHGLKVDPTEVSLYESGRRLPIAKRALAMAKILRINPKELVWMVFEAKASQKFAELFQIEEAEPQEDDIDRKFLNLFTDIKVLPRQEKEWLYGSLVHALRRDRNGNR